MWRPLSLLLLTTFVRGESLSDKINAAAAGFPGTVTIFAKNMETGATFGRKPDDKVKTASTIKLAILAAAFQAVKDGKVKWTDLTTLRATDKVSGSGILTEFSDGVKFPLQDLAHLMIVMSDNTATNLVLDSITADYVNEQMDKLGFPATRSMRKVRGDRSDLKNPSGFSKAGRMPENEKYGLGSTTPHEMVNLIEKIERGEIVSKEASAEMIKILKRQQDHNGIARRTGDSPVANKAGALNQFRADVGIVYTKRGRIAMAIYCDDIPKIDWSSDNPGLLMIAKIADLLLAEL